MFSEFLLVFMTFIGVGFVGDYSIILGLFIFSVLTYLCACNCLKESVGETVNGETESRFHFVHQYISTVGNATRRSICAIRWSYVLVQIRRVLYILNVIKDSNIEQSESQFVEAERFQQRYSQQSTQGCSTPHSVNAEIKTMVDCILREYIKWWYHNKISQDTQFPSDVNCIIYETLTAFCNDVSTVKRKTLCCHFIQLYLHFFFHFKEALNKVNFEQQNILEVCISKKKEILENFKMRHWAMKDKMTEWFYLQSMMTSLIDLYGPTEILFCPILHSVLIEILTRTVMYSLVNTLSDPDRINSWILKLLQNVLKNESESLVHFINTSNKAASNTADDVITDSPNFKKPVILLSNDDTSVAAQNTCVSIDDYSIANEHSNISWSSSKFLDLSTEKISDLSTDIDYTISDISQNSSQGIVDSAITNSDQQCLLFAGREVKAISSQNLSNKSLNFQELQASKSSDFLEVARLKRSKSADYIRQMPNVVSLYPLNRQSGSIKVHNKKNKSPMLARLVKTSRSCDVEIAEEAVEKELPPLFTDVKIVETQQQESTGHTPYTLYCIQYLGMFQSTSNAEAAPILVRQTVNIKRRFKEFLALQLRLEDDPSLKRCLKGIKGPSKWQATPFTHLDKKNVAERKTFLEKYLQDLCKQDEISKSSELQEFLAYGGDASIAFVRKSFDITVPRIDKMIARSVKGAIGLFRTALPTPTTEVAVAREFNSQDSELEVIPDESSEYDFQVYLVDFSVCGPEILPEIDFLITSFDDYYSSSESSYYDNKVPNIHKPILYHSISISDHDSCSCMDIETMIGSLREENHLANVIIDFVVESLHRLPGPNTTSHVHLVKFLCGSILDNFVTTKLDEVNEDKCARLLHSFHKALWPEDKLGSKKGNKVPDLPAILVKVINTCHKDLLKTKWFGQKVHYILGPGEISNAIEMIIGSLQNESLNRCFLFYALDAVCQVLCSKDKQH